MNLDRERQYLRVAYAFLCEGISKFVKQCKVDKMQHLLFPAPGSFM